MTWMEILSMDTLSLFLTLKEMSLIFPNGT